MAVLVLAAIAVIAGIFVVGRLAVATADKGEARHGADAAALAGAQAVLDDIPDAVAPGFLSPPDIPVLLGGGRCLQTGLPEATRLAQANGDSLTSYCYNSYTDEIQVSVSGDDGARAEAIAATSFDAGACRLDPSFIPPTQDPDGNEGGSEPGDDSADEPGDPVPLPPVRTVINCGMDLAVTLDPVDARFRFVGLEMALGDVKPRLTR